MCCEQKEKSQTGTVLNLSTFFKGHKWTGIETQILFLPIRKRKPAYFQWWILTHSARFSNCTVSYIIYNSLRLVLLVSLMPVYLSAPLQLCTFLLPVSSGTLLMIKACSLKPLKPLLLIYLILVPKHPSISHFFHPNSIFPALFPSGPIN